MAFLKSIDKLTLKEMMLNFENYIGLPDGLMQLPIPDNFKINKKQFSIPQDLEEFTKNLCYGQRIFLTQKEENDFGLIIRMIDGYYYSLYTGQIWDSDKALLFGKYVLTCKVKEIYPVAMYLTRFVSEMAEREQKLLYREPSKVEKAAGIERLNIFTEMSALDFLRDAMKITIPEVLLTPYNECLVRFMMAKETSEFQERYYELIKKENEPKSKFIK